MCYVLVWEQQILLHPACDLYRYVLRHFATSGALRRRYQAKRCNEKRKIYRNI